ncbi:hypothetical protein U3516DRAFT_606619, partial [Neocallimastix sp. 'constans']
MMISKESKKIIIELIKNKNLVELKKFIQKYNIILKEFKDQDNFDILINAIENDTTLEIIKYIIYQCQYKTLNYTFCKKKRTRISNREEFSIIYKVPLFTAVNKENYVIANYLIDNHADINYTIGDRKQHPMTIINYLCQLEAPGVNLNTKKLKYILSKGFQLKGINPSLISLFIKQYKNNLLEVIFRHFIFDNAFILSFIHIWKNSISISSEQLHHLIFKEKSKIEIKNFNYQEALKGANELRFNTIDLFLENETKTFPVLFEIIKKYKIMEKAVKHYNYGYPLIKKLLSNEYSEFDINDTIFFEN